MENEKGKLNFRMTKDSIQRLVDLIRPFVQKRSSRVRQNVLILEKRVAVTVYYLKDQGSMQMTINCFELARCTVGLVI